GESIHAARSAAFGGLAVRRHIRKVVVLGGGTTGWIAASYFDIWRQLYPGTSITVIESPRLGIIGTGEGSTLLLREFLAFLGISELEFVRETGATYKLGISFRDWRKVGERYLNPFTNLARTIYAAPLNIPIDLLKLCAVSRGDSNSMQF